MSRQLVESLINADLTFADIEVGDKFTTPGRTITEADIVAFTALSGDTNSIHTDAVYAENTVHGERIAQGVLVLAVMSGLCIQTPVMRLLNPTIIGLGELTCRFQTPCKINDTIHVCMEVVDKRITTKKDKGILVIERRAINQRNDVVISSQIQVFCKITQ